ncbi:MAG: hypothetical protein IK081_13990, partial [Lachnospiraceae bacterium]|nr:hypothetical protein [Lachnospiraceae bacterium]
MKYENAKDVLPAKLLEEVQKYAEGKVIYIPRTEKGRGWGEASGYREKLNKRNAMICSRYSAGQSIMEIAEEFFLSPETIKKLVYGKKVELPQFSPSIASAERYAAAGMGEEWVRTFLSLRQKTMPDMGEYFASELVRIPLRLIEAGSAKNMAAAGDAGRLTEKGCPGRLTEKGRSSETAESGLDCYEVPLIVVYEQRLFSVPFQPEYLEQLRKEKRNAHYAFIFAKNEDYGYFWNQYGK